MKLLHLDSSILGENSVSRAVSAAVVAQLKSAHPQLEVAYRDLVADPLPHLTLAALADHELVDQFLASDVVVIGAAMYNFSLATQLKAWIDRVSIAGKTFRYTEAGAQSRGGLYGAGSPAAAMEHAETYLRGVFGFLGVTDLEFIIAEGIAMGPEQRASALAGALGAAGQVAPVKAAA